MPLLKMDPCRRDMTSSAVPISDRDGDGARLAPIHRGTVATLAALAGEVSVWRVYFRLTAPKHWFSCAGEAALITLMLTLRSADRS